MVNKVEKAIADYSLLNNGDNIIVALSGGADSVSLLYILNSLKEKYNLNIYACHLNHQLRGEEADFDQTFVTQLCENLGVDLFTKTVDVNAVAVEQKISVELAGRNERYTFFAQLSEKLCAKVATAHTSSDNVETVLYNLTRGTAVNGLGGIKPKRDYIIRPLILCSREDVEQYCNVNNISYVTDSTNLSDNYTRNNIRHNVVPVLKQINPDLENVVTRMSANFTELAQYMDYISKLELKKAESEYGYSCEKLLQLNKAVLNNAVSLLLKKEGITTQSKHIELICNAMETGSSVDLTCGKRAVCKQGILRITDVDYTSDTFTQCKLSDYEDKIYYSSEDLKNINKLFLNDCIDCDIIDDSVIVRTRMDCDTFTLANRGVTKSLKKLFNELKIPAEKRNSLKLVAKGSTILWIESIGTSQQGRVNKNTKNAVRITGGKLW